jgi:ADP-ribose pyrophosphatase YjhB (NUDIX family)
VKTKSCGTATIREGKNGYEVLLVRPRAKQDKWAFPKGHISLGESEEDAAVRETLEETGITVQLLPEILGTTQVKLKKENKMVIIYMAVPEDPLQEPYPHDKENFQVAWWPIDCLPDSLISQQDLFAKLRSTVTRVFSTYAS